MTELKYVEQLTYNSWWNDHISLMTIDMIITSHQAMIWSYQWVKHVEQYPLWPNQIWAIKAMDSRMYYRGIFRLCLFRIRHYWKWQNLQQNHYKGRMWASSTAFGLFGHYSSSTIKWTFTFPLPLVDRWSCPHFQHQFCCWIWLQAGAAVHL